MATKNLTALHRQNLLGIQSIRQLGSCPPDQGKYIICIQDPCCDGSLLLQLGDYGKISKDSGEFRKKGNIFDHEATRECAFANFNETTGEEGSVEKYFSLRVKATDVHSGVKAYVDQYPLSLFPAILIRS